MFSPEFNAGFNPGFNPEFNPGFNPGYNPGLYPLFPPDLKKILVGCLIIAKVKTQLQNTFLVNIEIYTYHHIYWYEYYLDLMEFGVYNPKFHMEMSLKIEYKKVWHFS